MSVRRRPVIVAVVMGLVVGSFALRVYVHLRDGDAAETYSNVYGWDIHWSTAAAFFFALAMACVIGYGVRWWQLRQRAREEGRSMKDVLKDLKRNQ